MEIAKQHPEYGYRRTTSELVDQGFAVNHKVVQRLHRHWHLSVLRKVRPPVNGKDFSYSCGQDFSYGLGR